jgi:hypothetical protein
MAEKIKEEIKVDFEISLPSVVEYACICGQGEYVDDCLGEILGGFLKTGLLIRPNLP